METKRVIEYSIAGLIILIFIVLLFIGDGEGVFTFIEFCIIMLILYPIFEWIINKFINK